MTSCIIHIGMHKTGSTSIQHSLHNFSDPRFLYATLGDAPNHSLAMYSLFAARPARHHLHRAADRDEQDVADYVERMRKDLEASIREAAGRTLVVSGEDISVLSQADLLRLRDFFDMRFDQVRIVGYVRPPAGFITSSFQQRVKGGSLRRFDLDAGYRNYRECFGTFDAVFGRSRVELWKFDPAAFPQKCAVRDFCARLGIELPPKRIVRLNESLSRQMVSLLYSYQRAGQSRGYRALLGRESVRLSELLGEAGGDKFRLAPEVLGPILERNRADIGWMEERLGASLSEDLGEARPGDVRCEQDLLEPDERIAQRLRELLAARDAAPDGRSGDLIDLLHALRQAHGLNGAKPTNGELPMNIPDLIAEIRKADPQALEGIPQEQAEALVKSVFRRMNDALADPNGDVVRFGGLGQFKIRQVEKDTPGGKESRVRILFRRADSGPRQAQAGGDDE
jgi:nucleoid DNA-binding protein